MQQNVGDFATKIKKFRFGNSLNLREASKFLESIIGLQIQKKI